MNKNDNKKTFRWSSVLVAFEFQNPNVPKSKTNLQCWKATEPNAGTIINITYHISSIQRRTFKNVLIYVLFITTTIH